MSTQKSQVDKTLFKHPGHLPSKLTRPTDEILAPHGVEMTWEIKAGLMGVCAFSFPHLLRHNRNGSGNVRCLPTHHLRQPSAPQQHTCSLSSQASLSRSTITSHSVPHYKTRAGHTCSSSQASSASSHTSQRTPSPSPSRPAP